MFKFLNMQVGKLSGQMLSSLMESRHFWMLCWWQRLRDSRYDSREWVRRLTEVKFIESSWSESESMMEVVVERLLAFLVSSMSCLIYFSIDEKSFKLM